MRGFGRGRGRPLSHPGNSASSNYVKGYGLLAGYYDVNKRAVEIQARLDASIEEIRRTDFSNDDNLQCVGERGGAQDDILSMSLASYEDQLKKFNEQVEAFKGPHFTKVYRTMIGFTGKIEEELDALRLEGRSDLREKRKGILIGLDDMRKQLGKKVHANGRSCDQCEVKDRQLRV